MQQPDSSENPAKRRAVASQSSLNQETMSAEVADRLKTIGILFLEQKNYTKAKEYYKRALAVYEALHEGRPHKETHETFQAFGRACSEQIESEQTAALSKTALQKAAENEPRFLEAKEFYQLGICCYEQQDLQSAIWHYEIAISLAPEYFAVYCNLACLYHVNNDISRAEACFKKGLASDDAVIYCAYGQFLFQQGVARWQEAVVFLEKAIALNTANSIVIYKQLEAATINDVALQQIIEKQGEIKIVAELLAYYLLVKGCCRAGEKEVAKKWLAQFSENVHLNPSDLHQHLLTLACDEVGLTTIEKAHCLASSEAAEVFSKLLLEAARKGDVTEIVYCLNSSADIETKDTEGFTPLMLAIRGEHISAVEMLLEHKANINAKISSETVFHQAVLYNLNPIIVTILLYHGSLFDTPWHEAAYYGDIAKLNILLSRAVDKTLLPLFDYAGNPFSFYAAANSKLEVLQWCRQNAIPLSVKEHKADRAKRDADGKYSDDTTLLLFSVAKGHLPIAEWLIQEGISTLEEKNNYGQTALLLAIENGHLSLAQWLLSKGASIQNKDNHERTAVFYAIKNGHLTVLQWLVQQGASVEQKHEYGFNSVHVAAENNQFALISWLIAQGISLFAKSHSGYTLLLLAAEKGHLPTIEWLLSHEATLEETNKYGVTALMLAANYGHISIVKLLLARGVSVTVKNHQGQNALHMAIANGHLEIFELLFQYGARLENGTEMNQAFGQALSSGNVRLFDRLIEAGFDIQNYLNKFTSLQFSATTIKWLLSQKPALLEHVDNNRHTPLLEATYYGREKTAKCLIKQGAKLDAESKDGASAIIYAIHHAKRLEFGLWLTKQKGVPFAKKDNIHHWYGVLEYSILSDNIILARRLIELGAPVNFKLFGKLSLFNAIDRKHLDFSEWLIWERGACLENGSDNHINDTALHYAVKHQGILPFIQKLVLLTSSLELENDSGNTPLLQAAEYGNLAAVQYLVEKGASHKASSKTTLMVAAEAGQVVIVEWLLKQRVSLEEKDEQGQTALIFALHRDGSLDRKARHIIAKLLIEHGAEVNVQDNQGNTPLLLAVRYSNEDISITSYLVEHGASLEVGDSDGKTALFYALEWADKIFANWLIQQGANINAKINEGETILYNLTRQNNPLAVSVLLKNGARLENLPYDSTMDNNVDINAIDCALRYNNTKIVLLLLQYGCGLGLESYSEVYSSEESEQNTLPLNELLKQGVMDNQLVIGMKIHGKRVTRQTPGFEKAITTLIEFFDYQNSSPIPPANCLAFICACNHYLAAHIQDDEIREEIKQLKRYLILKQSSLVQTCLSLIRSKPDLKAKALSGYLPNELRTQIEHEPEIKIDETRFAQT